MKVGYVRQVTSPSYEDVRVARARIEGRVRRVVVSPADPALVGHDGVWLAHEYLQHTGTFKARGAANFTAAAVERGRAGQGVVIASGGNAGVACAWAAREHGVAATVFVPANAPAVKVARLHALGAQVRQAGVEFAEALEASHAFAAQTGALHSHAYDHPDIAAGAGTLLAEVLEALPTRPDTVVVAVGGGGLFTGTAVTAYEHGIRVVAAEPSGSRALHAALEAGHVVDVPVASVAADSLGARRCSQMALDWATRAETVSLTVADEAIVAARRSLWEQHRVVVEHGAATALAALGPGAYRPEPGEQVVVVLCGANTDPSDLAH